MRRAGRAVLGTVAAAGVLAATAAPPVLAGPATERVVVQASSSATAARLVRAAGGRVLRALPVVDGVAAALPAGAALPGAVVTPDVALRPQSTTATGTSPTDANAYPDEIRAAGLPPATRGPVTVALLDTGISAVPGLAGRVVPVPDPNTPGATAACANFSHEDGCGDSYGHGTFLAGLIAGGAPFPGVDPAARLVSIKIAGRDGAADVSQVLAGIQYAVSFKDALGISVLNLSLGTDSTHDLRSDPLNRAVERAWQAGIVVVVAASNRGPGPQTVSKPGDDPLVVTVGAVDDRGTSAINDDTQPAFSGRGPVVEGAAGDLVKVAKPDVVAPGVGLISTVSPGSHIEQTAPPSSVATSGYRRGSGTSQATAVVSGAVALLLERRAFTPDEVKAALVKGAHAVGGTTAADTGAGIIDVSNSVGASVTGATQPVPEQRPLDGLDASRAGVQATSVGCGVLGTRQLVDSTCSHVQGQQVALADHTPTGDQLRTFDALAYATSPWTGNSWYSSQWVAGNSWYGNSWYGNSWYGNSWYGYDGGSASEGQSTPLGTVLAGSAFYGVWR